MENLFEIGDLGIVRDIPTEIAQLESANRALQADLQKQKSINGFLIFCLAGLVIYVAIKTSSNTQNEK